MDSRVCLSNAEVSDADRVSERAEILKELEQLPDDTLIDTKKAGAYLDMHPRNVALLYHDRLVEGVKNRGPKGRIKIRLGSLRRMSGQMKKVRK